MRRLALLVFLCAAPVAAETKPLTLSDFLGQAYILNNGSTYAVLDATEDIPRDVLLRYRNLAVRQKNDAVLADIDVKLSRLSMVDALVASHEGRQLAYEVLLCGARDYRKDIEEALHDDITAPLVREAARVDALIVKYQAKVKRPVVCGFDACTIGRICKCYGLWHPERKKCRVCTVRVLVECRSWWDEGERCKTDEGRIWLRVVSRVEHSL